MKLLFDQNISHRVLLRLSARLPHAKHVRDFNMQFATDSEIWTFAKENGFAIVTLHADFKELATLYGHPPRIIWLRFGNTQTQELAAKLLNRLTLIEAYLTNLDNSGISCLEIVS